MSSWVTLTAQSCAGEPNKRYDLHRDHRLKQVRIVLRDRVERDEPGIVHKQL